MLAVRVAILGVGRLGAFHAKVLSETKDVDELRVYDADPTRAKEVAGSLKAQAGATVGAALRGGGTAGEGRGHRWHAGRDAARGGVAPAVIVTPTDAHAPLIKKCLDARIATFCEKPIAIGIPETRHTVPPAPHPRGRRS